MSESLARPDALLWLAQAQGAASLLHASAHWVSYGGGEGVLLAVALLVAAGGFAYAGKRVRVPLRLTWPGAVAAAFMIAIWLLAIYNVLVATYVYGPQVKHAYPGFIAARVRVGTFVDALITFLVILYLTRRWGWKIALASAVIGTAAAPMIFELPFDLFVMTRTNPPIPAYPMRPCPQARRSVIQILPSKPLAPRSKKGRALSFCGSSGCGPSFCSPPIGEHEPRIDDKDVQRIDGRGAMAVVRLEIKTRQPLADGRKFDHAGCYEQLDGTAHFAVDPAHRLNCAVTDIDLAERGRDGLVHFTADVRILAPADQARGNHRLLFDVPNRGNRLALATFNGVPRPIHPAGPTDAGNGFLMRHGYTVVWCGWQHDVPEADGLMRIKVPEAQIDGRPVSGRLLVGFQPSKPSQVQLLSDRGHRPYPSDDLDNPNAVLLVRDGEEARPRTIPRESWSFARLEAGRIVPDPNHVYLTTGFEPGRIYEVIYTTTGAPVIGLGLLAARDIVSFLRHSNGADNPCAGDIQQAYAFGASQSGRFLRQLLYLGLNEDEAERMVFDGLLVHIAGGKRGGDFNMRFGQPSASLPSDPFPFNEMGATDPVSGRSDGLLERLAVRHRVPKIFFTNTSCEYWRGDASLIHTDATGTRDIEPIASSRFYHFAGTQHSAGTLPLTDTNPQNGERGQQALNSVDYNPLLRALLVRMDRWVSQGEEPPLSRYPRVADGSAVAPERVKAVVTSIPGVGFPTHPPRVTRLDFGREAANGIATTLPPREGEAYPHFVPSVDPDGNELSGIRLPDVTVPLATYTGWNLRHPQIGAPERLMSLIGSTIPFPATEGQRAATGESRRSISARYPGKAAYLDEVSHAAQCLIDAGYLLPEDLERIFAQSAHRWDLLASAPESAAAQ